MNDLMRENFIQWYFEVDSFQTILMKKIDDCINMLNIAIYKLD